VPRSARRRRSRLDDRALRARRRDADAFARRSTFARAVARESAVRSPRFRVTATPTRANSATPTTPTARPFFARFSSRKPAPTRGRVTPRRATRTHHERRHRNLRLPGRDQPAVVVDHQRASRRRPRPRARRERSRRRDAHRDGASRDDGASNASTRSRRERTTDEEIVDSKRSQTFYSNKEIFLRELIRCEARTATRFARDGDRRIAMRWRRLTLRDDDARGRARGGRTRARDA